MPTFCQIEYVRSDSDVGTLRQACRGEVQWDCRNKQPDVEPSGSATIGQHTVSVPILFSSFQFDASSTDNIRRMRLPILPCSQR